MYGKPLGLWYAPDMEWVKRLDSIKTWDITAEKSKVGTLPFVLDYYTRVLTNQEIPMGTASDVGYRELHYVYNFPLKDSFETDIGKPATNKIYKLTATNIEEFETAFKPYYIEKLLSELKRPITRYEINLNARMSTFFKGDESKVLAFLATKGITPTTDVNKYLRYMIRAFLIRELGANAKEEGTLRNDADAFGLTKKEFKSAVKSPLAVYPDGMMGTIELFNRIRMLEYGQYYEDVMRKQWGGIEYDASLFVPDIESKYPFLPYIEVPSGCLWSPQDVMPTYTPKPIAVLGLATTPEMAATLEASVPEQYRPQLYIAGYRAGALVLFKKGSVTGGFRVQTLRRTTRRLSKNGRRLTRQSKHGRNRRA
jgi:hypothetical protein